ncbi:MAG: AI-2E family transporter [Moraxellaceae bacterium]|nr:AI-2E family transporter [Moraxellaceae bacterium]MDZ4386449.1 AI-2E family transporter [Moraxellaceae bacterium]
MHQQPLLSRLPMFAALTVLVFLSFKVLQPFIISVTWAAILVFVSWPLYLHLLKSLKGRRNLAALIMTIGLTLITLGPITWLLLILQMEVRIIFKGLVALISQESFQPPDFITQYFPWLAQELQRIWQVLHDDPDAIRANLRNNFGLGLGQLGFLAGEVGRNLAKLAMTIFTAFFLYRDGERILQQLRHALRLVSSASGERYLSAAGEMTRAVVFGIVLTALAQAILAGIGYAVAGAPNPVFLTAVTFIIALIPFGTPFAWGAVALWLLADGQILAGIGLAIWGTLVVSTIDNIIRPLVISNSTRVSFLLVMFGVLGGLAAFGMIGLFIGPVILAVLSSLWQEWLNSPALDNDSSA